MNIYISLKKFNEVIKVDFQQIVDLLESFIVMRTLSEESNWKVEKSEKKNKIFLCKKGNPFATPYTMKIVSIFLSNDKTVFVDFHTHLSINRELVSTLMQGFLCTKIYENCYRVKVNSYEELLELFNKVDYHLKLKIT